MYVHPKCRRFKKPFAPGVDRCAMTSLVIQDTGLGQYPRAPWDPVRIVRQTLRKGACPVAGGVLAATTSGTMSPELTASMPPAVPTGPAARALALSRVHSLFCKLKHLTGHSYQHATFTVKRLRIINPITPPFHPSHSSHHPSSFPPVVFPPGCLSPRSPIPPPHTHTHHHHTHARTHKHSTRVQNRGSRSGAGSPTCRTPTGLTTRWSSTHWRRRPMPGSVQRGSTAQAQAPTTASSCSTSAAPTTPKNAGFLAGSGTRAAAS